MIKDLEQIVEAAATKAVDKAEKKFEKHINGVLAKQQKQTEEYIKGVVVQEREQTEKYVNGVLKKQQETTERYVGGLKEDFGHKLDAVMEYVKDIPAIKEKQDMMFEQMGQMAVDIEVIKETVKGHEPRLQKVEAR